MRFSGTLWCLLGALSLLLVGCGSPDETTANNAAIPTFYVSLQGSNAIEQLPSGKLIQQVANAHYIALSPNGKLLLASHAGGDSVSLLDIARGSQTQVFRVGRVPQGVTFSPNGRWAAIIGAAGGNLYLIDMTSRQTGHRITVGKNPHNAVFSPDGKYVYVTLQNGAAVAVVNVAKQALDRTIPVGINYPHNLVISPDGKVLWIRGFKNKVAAVSIGSGTTFAVIPVSKGHAGITITPDGKYVFTGGIGGNTVDVIDTATQQVIKKIPVGQGPHGVTVGPKGSWVFAAITGDNKVVAISTDSLTVEHSWPVQGTFPFWLSVASQ